MLKAVLTERGLGFVDAGAGIYRILSTEQGHTLMYRGITLSKGAGGNFEATYDEDCRMARGVLGSVTQHYLRKHYLWEAMQQGDQIVKEYVATGYDQDPLIEPGDIVIVAVKG